MEGNVAVRGRRRGRMRGRDWPGHLEEDVVKKEKRKRGWHLPDAIRATLVDIVVNHSLTLRDWIESSVQPQQIQCCYNKSDISTRAQG